MLTPRPPASYRYHGDLVEVTGSVGNAGGIVVYGRSDTTLKPGGVRIGTAEVYRFAEEVPAVEDSLVIGDQIKVGKRAGDVRIVLFVKLTPVRRRAPPRSPAPPAPALPESFQRTRSTQGTGFPLCVAYGARGHTQPGSRRRSTRFPPSK